MSQAGVPQTDNVQLSHSASSYPCFPNWYPPLSWYFRNFACCVLPSLSSPPLFYLAQAQSSGRPKECPNWQNGRHSKRIKANQKDRRKQFYNDLCRYRTCMYIYIYLHTQRNENCKQQLFHSVLLLTHLTLSYNAFYTMNKIYGFIQYIKL